MVKLILGRPVNGYKHPNETRKSELSWFCHGLGVQTSTRINRRLTAANPHKHWAGGFSTQRNKTTGNRPIMNFESVASASSATPAC
jgi:hypothetical protein